MSDDGLEFFNSLSGNLGVTLSEAAKPVSEALQNLAAVPTAKLVAVTLRMQVYLRDERAFRDLTDEEWQRVVLRAPSVKLRGESDMVVEVAAPATGVFTVRDMTHAIEEAERKSRGDSEWLGGIDVHHVFFEGIEESEDGVWDIHWGS